MTDETTLERDLELTRGLVSDQNKMIESLQDGIDRATKTESAVLQEVYLYREALTAVLRNVPTQNLADYLPGDADFCLQRRNDKVIPVRFSDRKPPT